MAVASQAVIAATGIGTPLLSMMNADVIQPGTEASYQLCKTLYLWHPMGAKIVEAPILMAMSQQRLITISRGPEEKARDAFIKEWKKLRCDEHIKGVMYTARTYGIGSVAYIEKQRPGGENPNNVPLELDKLATAEINFNVLDPLNTAGSLVLNQDPTSPDFQKNLTGISIAGMAVHPSRSCTVLNEQPVYIAYTPSAFGYVGRSVYQRSLYPLKSFIQSMVTDDMVTRKAGLLVAMLKSAGSVVNRLMQLAAGVKRNLLKDAETDNVISIDVEESIETLNMQNIDKAMLTARKNIIENIATGSGTPAKLLLQESFAEGFGEGTEDAKHVVQFINNIRESMQPLYDYFDRIVMHRAWTPEFFETVKAEHADEYGNMDFKTAFYQWRESFKATWPSLLEEPESEQSKTDKVKIEGIIDVVDSFAPNLDPENKALLIEWAQDNLNEMKERMFRHAMVLDTEALKDYEPPLPQMGGEGGAPGGQQQPQRRARAAA